MLPWFCSLVTCISVYVRVNALHTLTFNSFPSAARNHSGISAWRAGQTIDILTLAVTAGGSVCVYTLGACVCRDNHRKGNTWGSWGWKRRVKTCGECLFQVNTEVSWDCEFSLISSSSTCTILQLLLIPGCYIPMIFYAPLASYPDPLPNVLSLPFSVSGLGWKYQWHKNLLG